MLNHAVGEPAQWPSVKKVAMDVWTDGVLYIIVTFEQAVKMRESTSSSLGGVSEGS